MTEGNSSTNKGSAILFIVVGVVLVVGLVAGVWFLKEKTGVIANVTGNENKAATVKDDQVNNQGQNDSAQPNKNQPEANDQQKQAEQRRQQERQAQRKAEEKRRQDEQKRQAREREAQRQKQLALQREQERREKEQQQNTPPPNIASTGPGSVPSTGPSPSEIPSTGPEGYVITSILVTLSIFGVKQLRDSRKKFLRSAGGLK